MKHLLITLALFCNTVVASAQTGAAWAWSAGKINNNGSVNIKSVDGATTYSTTQNPTGAVAKTNQNALTQAPTVVIQSTAGAVFNYTTDCYIVEPTAAAGTFLIGAGKVDTATNKFTGLLGSTSGPTGTNSNFGVSGATVLSMLTGASIGSSPVGSSSSAGAQDPKWCGSDGACAKTAAVYDGFGNYHLQVAMVAAMPTNSYQKCYP